MPTEEAPMTKRPRATTDSGGLDAIRAGLRAGVPHGTFAWNPNVDPTAGMLRLVFGLGH